MLFFREQAKGNGIEKRKKPLRERTHRSAYADKQGDNFRKVPGRHTETYRGGNRSAHGLQCLLYNARKRKNQPADNEGDPEHERTLQ